MDQIRWTATIALLFIISAFVLAIVFDDRPVLALVAAIASVTFGLLAQLDE